MTIYWVTETPKDGDYESKYLRNAPDEYENKNVVIRSVEASPAEVSLDDLLNAIEATLEGANFHREIDPICDILSSVAQHFGQEEGKMFVWMLVSKKGFGLGIC